VRCALFFAFLRGCLHRDTFAALGCDSLYLTPYEMSQDCFDIMDTLFTYIDDLNPCTYCYTNELHSAMCAFQIRADTRGSSPM
jgi:hypothetical protein